MSWTKKVKNPRSILDVGQEVEVVVSEVDPEKRRLSLSLRATEPNPWEQVAESYSVGGTIKGTVRNLTDFGAFVEIVPGVDGLVHISDMSWTRRINHPSEVVQKGEEVEAVITSIDSYNQRISLSMKELLPNEWEEYANAHGVGDVVTGRITNVTDFGVFVELAPGVEGLCHISEIDRDEGLSLAEMFSAGQPVRCRILRIDWHESRIGLSMHGVEQDGVEDEAPPEEEASAAGDTTMAAALRAGGVVDDRAEAEATSDDVSADEGGPEEPEAVTQEETPSGDETPEESEAGVEPANDDEGEPDENAAPFDEKGQADTKGNEAEAAEAAADDREAEDEETDTEAKAEADQGESERGEPETEDEEEADSEGEETRKDD
jgi:small subunit ribosomal protein S1